MSRILVRVAGQGGVSNYERGNSWELVQYYEASYSTSGPQEWLLLPGDAAMWPISVAVTFQQGAGECFLECTNSPPSTLGLSTSTGVVPSGPGEPANYTGPYTYGWPIDAAGNVNISADTVLRVQGPTAIRISVVSGTATISVRC